MSKWTDAVGVLKEAEEYFADLSRRLQAAAEQHDQAEVDRLLDRWSGARRQQVEADLERHILRGAGDRTVVPGVPGRVGEADPR